MNRACGQSSSGNDSCVQALDVVTLVAPTIDLQKPLFLVRRDGVAFNGSTQVGFTLSEINPPLAQDIAILEVEIAAERKWLLENASKAADLAERLDMLQQLDMELHDLVSRPLDEISAVDLDAILKRYEGVIDDATRAALKQLLADLKKSVEDLKDELASLLDHFGAQADEVADLVTGEARAAGFSPDDPNGYSLGTSQTPWVEVPDVSGVAGAFDPGKDPYAAYADAVIAALSEDVLGNVVVKRADFVTHVRAWRANMAAIEKALLARMSVSQAETAAFLNAQIRVANYVKQYMDASDWFLDSPVPADLRAQVDGVLRTAFGPLAEEMKDNLNQWDGFTLNLEETQLVETIRAFAGAVSFAGDKFGAYAEVMKTLVHASTRIGIGFVPYVGPALDLCEAVTGKRFCLPGGEELSTEERIFSGVGFGFGKITKAWAGIKASGVKPGAKVVAAGIVGYTDEFLEALRKNRRPWYTGLHGKQINAAIGRLANQFEGKAGIHLMKEEGRQMLLVGDDVVRDALNIESGLRGGLSKAPDFVTVTKGNKLALSEVKQLENIGVSSSRINANNAVNQLRNGMKALREMNLASDVERLEIIIPKGAKFAGDYGVKDGYLITFSTGKAVEIEEGFKNVFIKVVEI